MPEPPLLANNFLTMVATCWVIFMVLGCLIGASKGRALSGFVWTFFFGIFGLLIIVCLPNLKKQKADEERNLLLLRQIQLQEAQLQQSRLQSQASAQPMSSSTNSYNEPMLRIASNNEELGELPVSSIKLMLKSGKLTPGDLYFDHFTKEWLSLDRSPQLNVRVMQNRVA